MKPPCTFHINNEFESILQSVFGPPRHRVEICRRVLRRRQVDRPLVLEIEVGDDGAADPVVCRRDVAGVERVQLAQLPLRAQDQPVAALGEGGAVQ